MLRVKLMFEELGDGFQRLLAGAQQFEVGLENMHHPLPHMHFAPSALAMDEVGVPAGVIEEDLVFANVNQYRRQVREIAVQWRRERISGAVLAEVEARRRRQPAQDRSMGTWRQLGRKPVLRHERGSLGPGHDLPHKVPIRQCGPDHVGAAVKGLASGPVMLPFIGATCSRIPTMTSRFSGWIE